MQPYMVGLGKDPVPGSVLSSTPLLNKALPPLLTQQRWTVQKPIPEASLGNLKALKSLITAKFLTANIYPNSKCLLTYIYTYAQAYWAKHVAATSPKTTWTTF